MLDTSRQSELRYVWRKHIFCDENRECKGHRVAWHAEGQEDSARALALCRVVALLRT